MALTDEQVSAFLSRPLTARIAAVDPLTMQPRVLPVWFIWDGREIWFSGYRCARRFSDLEQNHQCALVVDGCEDSAESGGILVEGEAVAVFEPADLVREMSARIYGRYLDVRVIQMPEIQASINDPENVVYRLKPDEVYGW
jgi:nitroimidazol reductase NimA-like FMN-containing flavoprotein (pyridoxamine 5'-phosphate oxidase superfamily)